MSPVFGVSLAARLMHALLLAVAAGVLASQLTLASGVMAAAVGAFFGSLLGERLEGRGFRTGASVLLGLGVAGLGLGLTSAMLGSFDLAVSLGPTITMSMGELFRWGPLCLGVALVLRATALRYRAALAVEGSLAVLVVATRVAAHRDGMIARPLEISDWFWRQNIDPVLAFLGVGLVGALLLAGVLAYGRSARRTFAQLVLVLLLGLVLTAYLHDGPPDQPQKNAVGAKLNKDKDDRRDGPSSAGGGSGKGKGESDHPDDNRDLPPPPPEKGGQNRPTAVVVFQRDVQPFGEVFYFRHAAFSQFNGARLVEATVAGVDPDARYERSGAQDIPGPHRAGLGRASVATDVAILSEHSRTFALIDAVHIEPRPNPEPARFRRAYRVVSQVPTATVSLDAFLGLEPGNRAWSDRTWEHYTELPRDERYHDLARRLQSDLRPEYRSDPVALAFAVRQYLEKNTIYSFQRSYQGADPTADFLFSEDKRGYCVHLAHAGAYLLRALGVPTRVSAGYAVPAENLGRGSALLIKDGDAHAWMEINLQGVGWLPIEITPEQTDIEPSPFQEQDLQQLLGEMARQEGRFEREASGPSAWVQSLKWALGQLPKLLVLLLLVAYLIKGWRLLRPAWAPDSQWVYRGALDALSAMGWVRARGETRERFATRVAEYAPDFVPLTRLRVGVVMGSEQALASAQGPSTYALYRSVFTQARQSVPAWRFWLGLLNPVSWMWSR